MLLITGNDGLRWRLLGFWTSPASSRASATQVPAVTARPPASQRRPDNRRSFCLAIRHAPPDDDVVDLAASLGMLVCPVFLGPTVEHAEIMFAQKSRNPLTLSGQMGCSTPFNAGWSGWQDAIEVTRQDD